MSLPAPNLDDRTWKDLVDDAIKLVQKRCPEWTDFNESDPGRTLIELMAFMTETIIYRLNKVPEKNFIKFLELMGICLKPREPARAWAVFTVTDGAQERDLVKFRKGEILTTGKAVGQPLVFETVDSLNPTPIKIKKIYSVYKEKILDCTKASSLETEDEAPILLVEKEKSVPHFFYMGFHHLEKIDTEMFFKVAIEVNKGEFLPLDIKWQYWDGENWSFLDVSDETDGFRKSGAIIFKPFPEEKGIQEKEIDGKLCLWIRISANLTEVEKLPELLSVKRGIKLSPEGLSPEKCFLGCRINEEQELISYIPLDLSLETSPFGQNPKKGDVFYCGSKVFSRVGAKIIIEIEMSEDYKPDKESYKDLEIHWEYFSKKGRCKLLGITTSAEIKKSMHHFTDQTNALIQSGTINFTSPDDIEVSAIQGESNYWIRARLGSISKDVEKIKAPIIKNLVIKFEEELKDFEYYLSRNDYLCEDLTCLIRDKKQEELFRPFKNITKDSVLYLAFDAPFSNKLQRIYFGMSGGKNSGSAILWEYYTAGKVKPWDVLDVKNDSTKAFSQKGAIEFNGPVGWTKTTIFEENDLWLLRARWNGETGMRIPQLSRVHLNAVEVLQGITVKDEILGSSSGRTNQEFALAKFPIQLNTEQLSDPLNPEIWVRELEEPTESEIQQLKNDMLRNDINFDDRNEVFKKKDYTKRKEGETVAVWVRWRQVINFFNSKADSRSYTLDLDLDNKTVVTFGDGKRGKIPPVGRDNIKCEKYRVCAGERGNVGKNTITILEKSFPCIEKVTNPGPADGGTYDEKIEDAKLRGPWVLKHRYRAVTKKDFEELAREASGEVARSHCFMEGGIIIVVIIQKGDSLKQKLVPTPELIQKVQNYLDERRLITTIVNVVVPEYIEFSLEIKVCILPEKLELMEEIVHNMKEKLKRFFDPLQGGQKHEGWKIGRSVHKSEIFYLLEDDIESVDHVETIIMDGDENKTKIKLKGLQLPHLIDPIEIRLDEVEE